MVLAAWHSHCESSPGSVDECRLERQVAVNPQTKPTDLGINNNNNNNAVRHH